MWYGKCGTSALMLVLGLTMAAGHAARAEGVPPDDAATGGTSYCINGYSRIVEYCEAPVLPEIATASAGTVVCVNGYRLVADTCKAPERRVLAP